MLNEIFENLCQKYNDSNEVLLEREYNELLKEIPNLGTLDNYKIEQKELIDTMANKIDKSTFNDTIINHDEIKKENYCIYIYLFNYKIADDNMLDENYIVKELTYKDIYEYNSIITNKETNNYISGIYSGRILKEEDANNIYDKLKKWFTDTDIKAIFLDIENRINGILNEEK